MAEKSNELSIFAGITESPDDNLLEIRDAEEVAIETDNPVANDAQQIREQIEETRSQMGGTINAIQERLSVANLTEQVKDQVAEQINSAVETAKDAFYDKTNAAAKIIGKTLAQAGDSDLIKKVRKNPWLLPVVGVSIGAILAGVLANSTKGRKKSTRHRNHQNKYLGQTRQQFKANTTNEKFRPANTADREFTAPYSTDESDEKNSPNTSAKLGQAANAAYRSVGDAAGKTYDNLGKASSYAYEKAGDLGEQAMKNYSYYIEENPLAVGAVIFAVGAAIGYAIPLTETENQYFGEARNNLLEKAKGSAQDAVETVKQAVGEAQQMLADEVKSQTA